MIAPYGLLFAAAALVVAALPPVHPLRVAGEVIEAPRPAAPEALPAERNGGLTVPPDGRLGTPALPV
ncbi:hypothetical protein EYW49_03340 [Siculibacillus lacustris]|uniref:Uncharacterized protein n=1 Tax=Siculibacillus lacustris TaxID=1549641 RepID=A0A4Q9VWR1_9HYPH|nr:hypothetical protein [Siculibacillus lacustris]TBW40772.1 hypothetical protein EYW49_03340 [Siculibacillus lacustris]